MSVSRKRLQIGALDVGGTMRDTQWYTHVIGIIVMAFVMVFSYAALLENGTLPALVGFTFGSLFLLLIYGHEFDDFYLHIGEKIKFGGNAYDPERNLSNDAAHIEIEENENQR